MPFIIAPQGPVELVHHAQASSLRIAEILHYARGGWAGVAELVHAAQAGVIGTVDLTHVAVARIGGGPSVPVQVIYGAQPVTVTAQTSAGPALIVTYADDEGSPTGTVTLPGTALPGGPTLTLDVTTTGAEGEVGTAPNTRPYRVRTRRARRVLDIDDQYEIQDAPGAETITVRGFTRAATRLGSVRLPELVGFMASPTPRANRRVPCSARPRPQTQAVSSVVAQAVRAAGLTLSFGRYADPLAGEVWTEWRTPYSTRGKSPQAVLQDTYLAIGWHPVIQRIGAASHILFLLPPGGDLGLADVSAFEVQAGGSRRRETAQLPATVTVKGADHLVDLPTLTDVIQLAPNPQTFEREVYPDIQWFITTPSSGGEGESTTGYNKVGGQIIGTYTTAVQDLTVTEQVAGKLETRDFGKVLISEESTDRTYDPYCKDQLTSEETRKTSWGYTASTKTTSKIVGRYGFLSVYPTGDLLGDEIQRTDQFWHEEGWVQARAIYTKKLTSTKQVNAEGALKDRGPLQAFEYVERLRLERYFYDGQSWWMEWSESGGQPIPVYDADSFEAVRMGVRGGTVTSGSVPMDAQPPTSRCPDPCATRKRAVPNVVRLEVQGGREGTDVERTVTWTEDRAALARYGRWVAQDLARRVTSTRTLLSVPDLHVGARVTPDGGLTQGGLVQSTSFEVRGGGGSSSLTLRSSEPVVTTAVPYKPDDPARRDIVLFRQQGGVTVDAFTGEWNGNTPIFKPVFVQVAGTQYPKPLDELEWVDDPRYGPTATGNYGQESLE
ncbi:hypothetical protein [Deinococcus radiotolerans]|uniref:Uncharacterized protein n=1 Tax=Deinococcus radiotolerans TaxID=1309407 RepID=A0ABQ2FQY4_9DEIO|nr:hypothetical protein [Deinococcus radiotolerans]GGL18240.1 hypothetical protein GCM10010844_41380 [Deinococcus radiotolerans]